MLVDFDFNISRFSLLDQVDIKFLMELHMLEAPLYHTGSRFLNNKYVLDDTDYDFFTNKDIGREVSQINLISENKAYLFKQAHNYQYISTKRYISNTRPKIDIFYIEDIELFQKYQNANYELKDDVEKAKNINKKDRVKYYIDRTGYDIHQGQATPLRPIRQVVQIDHLAPIPAVDNGYINPNVDFYVNPLHNEIDEVEGEEFIF